MFHLALALVALFAHTAAAGTGGLISVNVHTSPGYLGVAATGKMLATYTGWTSGAVWICYRSGTGAVAASPVCAAAGVATAVVDTGSGAATVCTASATTGAAVELTFTTAAQVHIRVRACTTATDVSQVDNADQTITVLAAATLKLSMPGSTLLIQRTGGKVRLHMVGLTSAQKDLAAWVTFKSHTSAIADPGNCVAVGASTEITTAGGDSSTANGVATADLANRVSAAVPYVDLTWTTAAQVHLRAEVCTALLTAGVGTIASGVMTSDAAAQKIAVTLTATAVAGGATTATPGDKLVATYLRWSTGAVWLCYRSGTAAVASPACAAAGTATAITTAASGAAVVCTASATTGAAVELTWTDVAQVNVRVRACTTATDTGQTDNANVGALTVKLGVSIAPTTLTVGAAITATYKGWTTGAAWLCYRSATAGTLLASPACAAAGTATAITAAGSGAGVVCTASAATGAAVTLTHKYANDTSQLAFRARVCDAVGDADQKNNGFDTFTFNSGAVSSSANSTADRSTGSGPLATTKVKVTQVYDFPSLTVATYTGNTKGSIQCAYANTVQGGSTWCVAGSVPPYATYKDGVALTSTAARRAAKVTFVLEVSTSIVSSTAAMQTLITAATATVFGTKLTAVNTATALTDIADPGIPVVAVADISLISSSAATILPSMLAFVSALVMAFLRM